MKKIVALLAVLWVHACSPQFQEILPENSVPALQDETLIMSDGQELPFKRWLPKSKPKAVLLALHGFNDYSNAFISTGEYMKRHGVAVYAYDQRGFGKTLHTGIWAGETLLTRDLQQVVGLLKERYDVPLFVLGESMGGAVIIAALVEEGVRKPDGVILVAPAVWGSETLSPFYRGSLWVVTHTLPFKRFTGGDLKILASNNIPMLRRMSQDPLIIKASRADAVYGMVHLMDSAYEKSTRLDLPILLLYGARDQVIPPDPIERVLSRFPRNVRVAYYPDGFHMLLRDMQGEQVMEDIRSWLVSPENPLPSGFGFDVPL